MFSFRLPGFSTNSSLPVYLATAVLARLANEGLKLGMVLAASQTPAGLKLGGLLVTAFLIPSVIAAPFVGRLADASAHPTRLYSAAFAFNAIMIAAVGLLLPVLHPAIILAMAAIGGAVGPLMMGGLSSFVGAIVPKDQLHRAYALDVVTYNVSAILAPAIVAFIADILSPLTAVLMLATFMGLSAVSVLRMRLSNRENRVDLPIASPLDGLRALWSIVPLRSTATATSISNIGMGILPIAATLLAHNPYRVNAGVLLSTMAVGALAGSLTYAARPFGTDRPHRLLPMVTLAISIPFLTLAFVDSTPIALALFALAGAINGPMGSWQFAVRDRFSPAPVRTQIFTLSTSLKTTFAAIGAAVAGLFSGLSPQVLLYIVTAAYVLGGAIALIDLARHPDLVETPSD